MMHIALSYSNRWHKIFDFNKRADGKLNYSLVEPYTTEESLKELVDLEKCKHL
jgi:hypothetical protein